MTATPAAGRPGGFRPPAVAAACVAACAYAAFACWVVRTEGREYRRALALDRRAAPAGAAAGPTAAPDSEKVPTSTDVIRDTPAAPAGVARAAPVPPPAVAAAPPPAPAAAAPDAPTPAPAALRPAGPAAPSWANSLDLNRLTARDEQRLGAELRQMILTASPVLDTGPWLERVERAAEPFVEARSRKDVPYQFTVLDSDAVNAFSTPGGYVYVSRGLFDLIGADEDYALEFVLGHEVAHVDMKHALAYVAARNDEAKAKGVDTLKQFFIPIAVGFPDDQEFEADAWAARRMTAGLDRTRRETLAFLRKFQGYAAANEFPNGRAVPKPGSNLVDNHFRGHPAAFKRLRKLDAIVSPAKVPASRPK